MTGLINIVRGHFAKACKVLHWRLKGNYEPVLKGSRSLNVPSFSLEGNIYDWEKINEVLESSTMKLADICWKIRVWLKDKIPALQTALYIMCTTPPWWVMLLHPQTTWHQSVLILMLSWNKFWFRNVKALCFIFYFFFLSATASASLFLYWSLDKNKPRRQVWLSSL